MRLNGASYEEVARAGGGIVSTVTATRAASEDELLAQALRRVDVLIAEGVTTIEIKSGYGLDLETERKMLQVAILFLFSGFLFYPITGAYGHGWGIDRTSSIKINDREIAISVELPPYFEQSEKKEIKIKGLNF